MDSLEKCIQIMRTNKPSIESVIDIQSTEKSCEISSFSHSNCSQRLQYYHLRGQDILHSRWWSRGSPMDPKSENEFSEGIF